MRDDLGVEVHEVNEALAAVLGEVPAENYRPPRELQDPPGIPFVFESYYFRRTIYLKIQIVGVRKPRVLVWSCHPPDYDWK
jgi:hypothetical protein